MGANQEECAGSFSLHFWEKKTLVQSRARNDSGVLGVGHVTGASGDNLQAGEISALLA